MFSLLKHILWLIHIAAIAYFVMKYVGYDINWHYFDSQKSACEAEFAQCRQDLIRTGLEGVKQTCEWKCAEINPKLLIKKKDPEPSVTTNSPSSDTIHATETSPASEVSNQ